LNRSSRIPYMVVEMNYYFLLLLLEQEDERGVDHPIAIAVK